MNPSKQHGRICKVVLSNRYGFIKSEHFDHDVFFHFSNIQGKAYTPRVGDVVVFDIQQTHRGKKAVQIEIDANTTSSQVIEGVEKEIINSPRTAFENKASIHNPVVVIDVAGNRSTENQLVNRRPPRIVLSGPTGVGKSTTINTLFGKTVSNVSHSARGTVKGEQYDVKFDQETLGIIDLPGLGDTPSREQFNIEELRKHAVNADVVIILVSPPRLVESVCCKILEILNDIQIPAQRILFCVNKLSPFLTQSGIDINKTSLTLDADPKAAALIEQTIDGFLLSLKNENIAFQFEKWQIIPFDAISGWNLNLIFSTLTKILPNETLVNLAEFYLDAFEEKRKRDKDELDKSDRKLREKTEEVEGLRKELTLEREKHAHLVREKEEIAHQRTGDITHSSFSGGSVSEKRKREKKLESEIKESANKISNLIGIVNSLNNEIAFLTKSVEEIKKNSQIEDQQRQDLRQHIKKRVADVVVNAAVQGLSLATGGISKAVSGLFKAIAWLKS
jgi:predicted GTPase/cold shock CspA family protein